jgi:hypothetical protein
VVLPERNIDNGFNVAILSHNGRYLFFNPAEMLVEFGLKYPDGHADGIQSKLTPSVDHSHIIGFSWDDVTGKLMLIVDNKPAQEKYFINPPNAPHPTPTPPK